MSYTIIHNTNHINPKDPVMMKAHRHPHASVMNGTDNGATIAPMLVPELKMPVASARSFLGNHSAVDLIAAGKLPDSVRPNAPRTQMKPNVVLTSACATAAMLHNNVARK